MRNRLKAVLIYFLFWIVFFAAARLLFIFTKYQEASGFSPVQLFSTFRHGIKLDLSATGYIMTIPVLLMIPGIYLEGRWFRKFMRYYTIVITALSSVIVVSDTLLYKYWGFRMDHTPFLYLSTPGAAMASVSTIQIIVVATGIILLTVSFIYLYYRFADRHFAEFGKIRFRFPALIFFVVLWGSLLIPIRGGVGIAPINAGTVYFSRDLFLNHTAINVVWNVGNSLAGNKKVNNPYQFYDTAIAKQMTGTLTADRGLSTRLVSDSEPNILLIVLESFGSAMIGPLGGDPLTTPNFNRYVKEGILFTRFYASGNRTDKAVPAILCGYPAQPENSIMKDPKKTQSLPGLVKMMNSRGYHTSFWYGGEINFANFNSFVINAGFRNVVTRNDFNPEFYNSKWGVHDHILFESLQDSMKNISEPFLKVVLTLSSHEPFDVPMEPVFRGNDDLTRFRNSIYYTDRSLGQFLDRAKTTEWWKNTLVVLVADHSRRNTPDVREYSDEIFKIPMLWLGGALSETGITIDKTGSQTDIPLTILNQLGLSDNYPFSKDLLSSGSASFAFYAFNEGFGFITDSSRYIYEHKLGGSVLEEGKNPEIAGEYGKAFLQTLFDDFLQR